MLFVQGAIASFFSSSRQMTTRKTILAFSREYVLLKSPNIQIKTTKNLKNAQNSALQELVTISRAKTTRRKHTNKGDQTVTVSKDEAEEEEDKVKTVTTQQLHKHHEQNRKRRKNTKSKRQKLRCLCA